MTSPIVPESKIALKVLEKIASSLDSIKTQVSKESEELVLKLPERLGEYSVALRIKSGSYGGKMHFSVPGLRRLQATALPTFSNIGHVFIREPEGFLFDPGKLPQGVEMTLLRFEFDIPEAELVEGLIQKNCQLDSVTPVDSENDSYWMSAQIKHPSFLRKIYSRLELYGVDFRVDVGVHQEVKNSLPQGIMRGIQRSAEFLGTTDREKLLRLMLEQRKMAHAQDIPEALRKLIDLFMPTRFRKFVEVNNPFRFQECLRGTEFFDRSYMALPKFMTVVSRTDLTLEEPAKQGTLVFKKKAVREEISKLFHG